jgi:hypothetical protein
MLLLLLLKTVRLRPPLPKSDYRESSMTQIFRDELSKLSFNRVANG